MKGYITKRLIYMFITLFLIASATFFLMKIMPGTPLSNAAKLTAEQEAIILEKYGLNDPIPIQYVKYMANVVTGDLGVSFQFDGRGVTGLIMDRIGPSATLGTQAIIFGAIFGILLGILSAIRYNTIWDYLATIVAVIGISIPSFVFAALMQYYIGVKLQWFPVAFWGGWEHTVMPTAALAVFVVAVSARFTRTELLEVLGQDYITTARAKGVSGFSVVFKHGIRNALIPLITILGPLAIGLMTGTLVIERIFSVPGLGEQFVRSIQTNDYPVIMGTTLFYSFFLILVILIVDILYGIIDPRIRIAGGKD
ncbi:oligopeptide ABC transporter permease [Pseudalkalibacillus salsuginis]|uniref:oligopeptide ABC transporter permease n=1 Tax=Pseudalkalibacillus salsuginis TaxID=2910972 RepID=UPI001F40F1F0|nr:oligopeptide ABC transporter permease [Pseudalkalibacillus salsuginis]MCF6409205.1 ABC transporter permease [Pseudalkalibacillus salsuginis]